jgi:hypothetical protein
MVLYTKEEKLQRKNTIHQWNALQLRDRILGITPTPSGTVEHHPRKYSKSPWCAVGSHRNLVTSELMGIPILECKNCGKIFMKGSYEGTETKREIRERHVPKSDIPATQKEFEDKLFEVMNSNPRR